MMRKREHHLLVPGRAGLAYWWQPVQLTARHAPGIETCCRPGAGSIDAQTEGTLPIETCLQKVDEVLRDET